MLDLLFLPGAFALGLAGYKYSERRAAQRAEASETVARGAGAASEACVWMIEATSTNNSYDPMGDVLSELDMDGVEKLLGRPLRADMEGYMT